MKPLTTTRRAVLSNAAQHPYGLAMPPSKLPPAPRTALAKALLGTGLLARAQGDEGQPPDLAWRLDGEAVFLRITEAGLQAIGAAPAVAPPEPQEGSVAEPAGKAAAAAQEGAEAAVTASEAAQGAPEGLQRAPARQPLRGAAQAVLAAWDDVPGGEHAGLATAIEALRQALAKPVTARSASGPRPPRAGTKHEAVLALLRRPEGASGPAIAAATGWAPHTVRGFLAGLKKCGIEVIVHGRVRQLGPDKEGAKGSYSIYRIAEAG
jgi:Protein of unknown function (DUF3489)